ncbi:MAG: hypothetical protein ACFFDK_16320 [Promethearchaeota archaeon]
MITGYSIILEDEILYCSNEYTYTTFEILLFIEKLIRSLNPKQTWRLNNLCFQNSAGQEERMIIKHLITSTRQNLFFCLLGDIRFGSNVAIDILEEFYDKINEYYKSVEVLKHASKKLIFREVVKIIIEFLSETYENQLQIEEINGDSENYFDNKILYCGISSQGLPITSQLYDKGLLNNLEKEINEENIELYSSNLSAQLATIEMNTLIRTNLYIKEIHINDFGTENPQKMFIFSEIYGYSLDIFASGNFTKIYELLQNLIKTLSQEHVLQYEFSGDLKHYKHLQNYLNNFVSKFDNHM